MPDRHSRRVRPVPTTPKWLRPAAAYPHLALTLAVALVLAVVRALSARWREQPVSAPSAPPRLPPAHLHLIDIENLVGGQVRRSTMRLAWAEYSAAVPVGPGHRVVVGVAARHVQAAAEVLPGYVELAVGANEPDGADRALLDSVHTPDTYRTVHIASCDHAFAPLAEQFAAAGAKVVQVIGVGVSSAALYLACPHQVYLPTRIAEQRRPLSANAPRPADGAARPHRVSQATAA